MKKTVRTIMFVATFSAVIAGCQKESNEMALVTPNEIGEESMVKRTVEYTINGKVGRIEIVGEEAWQAFLRHMVDIAESGYKVTFSTADASNTSNVAKETVTYTTADKDDAMAWSDTMTSNGYTVEINYDEVNNVFVCIAYRK